MKIKLKTGQLRKAAGLLILAAAILYGLRAVLAPLPGELERTCQLLRAGARCLTMTAAAVLLLRPGMKKENQFLLLGGLLGLCYLLMILPGTVPDEEFHYSCTLGLASRLVHGGPMVDAALLETAGLTEKTNTPETLLAMLQGLRTETLTGTAASFEPDITSYPVQYLPQVLAFAVGLLLRLNRWWLYLLADGLNLLFYLSVTWLAIKWMPKGKTAMMLIALLPMPLQQAGSLSPDGFINAMSFLYIALVFRAAEGEGRLSVKELLGLSAVGLLLAPAKGIYSLLLLLPCLIPAVRFGSWRKKALYIGGMLLGALALLLVFELTWMLGLEAQAEAAGVEYYTLTWCLTHPLPALKVVLNSALHPFCGAYGSPNLFWWLESGAGILLNTFTLLMPMCTIYPMLFIILLAALLVPENSLERFSITEQAWMGITGTLVFLAAFGIMMISWTPFGAPLIEGVQGRYFVPVFLLLFFCFRTGHVRCRRDPVLVFSLCFLALHWLCLEEIVNTFLAVAA